MPDDSPEHRDQAPSTDTPLKPWQTPEARAARLLRREQTRNFWRQDGSVVCLPSDISSVIAAACNWLLPWRRVCYPGKLRGVRQILEVSDATAERVLYGGDTSRAAMARLADLIEARSRSVAAIASALRDHIAARPRKVNGLQIIDAVTGLRKHQRRGGRSARSAVSAVEVPGDGGEVLADRGGETKL